MVTAWWIGMRAKVEEPMGLEMAAEVVGEEEEDDIVIGKIVALLPCYNGWHKMTPLGSRLSYI